MATEEIELLEAMFPEELKVHSKNKLDITLRPRTDLDSSQGIFVFITLTFNIPKDYPSVPPIMEVKNARGIDEAGTAKLINNLKKKAEELQGSPVLFELIQMARDLLTENNRPHEDCPICLVPFEESEDFIKTPCFHYFHNECFMSYCQTSVGDLRCPLCREILSGEFLSSIIAGHNETSNNIINNNSNNNNNDAIINNDQNEAIVPRSSSSDSSPPRRPSEPEHPPSRYIVVTNLGNEKKLDWQGTFDNIFAFFVLMINIYAAQSLHYLSVTSVIIEFKEISHAELAVANTDNTSIAGQKISCKYASPAETELFESAKQSAEIQQQIQALSLNYEKEHQNLLKAERSLREEQPPTQPELPPPNNNNNNNNNNNREQQKLRGPRHQHSKPRHPHPRSSSSSFHSSSSHTHPSHSSSPSATHSSTSSSPSFPSSSTAQQIQQPQRQPRKSKPQNRPPNNNNNNNGGGVKKKDAAKS